MQETYYQRLGDSSTVYIDQSKPKQIRLGNYTLCPDVLLGTGSFSAVYMCKNKNNQRRAVKILKKHEKKAQHIIKVAKAEVKILKKLDHPNIVKFLDSYQSQNNYYILFQYCQGKTLREIIHQLKTIDLECVHHILLGLIDAICYMNQKKVMHRDIKPDNIKYFNKKVTIIDFGFACEIPNGDKTTLRESVGTPSYMSLEMLQRKNYTFKSDIWSLGIVLYEIIYGKLPWNGRNQSQICANIIKNQLIFPYYPKIPLSLKRLIQGCLEKKPSDRIRIFSLIQKGVQKFNHKSQRRQLLQYSLLFKLIIFILFDQNDNYIFSFQY